MFTPRPYQEQAITAGVDFFNNSAQHNGFIIAPTGSGKSLIIANIAKELPGKTVVFQPSKEILAQNYAKYISYGGRAAIYSASAKSKFVDKVTFATIGSVINKKHLFDDCSHILIDECHLTSSDGGMYHDFIKANPQAKICGLTATPYRLESTREGAMLKFLNRTNPRIFNKVLYYIQNDVLFNAGYLAKLEYYKFDVLDRRMLDMNSSGTDFTDASLKMYYRKINYPAKVISYGNKILKSRKNLLIFCSLISEAKEVAKGIPGAYVVTGDTPDSARDQIINHFKDDKIRCVVNCGVLTTGFDKPNLEAVLIARSTMSLGLYYQIAGRAFRTHADKNESWIVDLGGNIDFFGKFETMQIVKDDRGLYSIWNNNRQLTQVPFQKK